MEDGARYLVGRALSAVAPLLSTYLGKTTEEAGYELYVDHANPTVAWVMYDSNMAFFGILNGIL